MKLNCGLLIIFYFIFWTSNGSSGEIIEVIEEGSNGEEIEIRTNENSFNNETQATINPSIAAVLDQKPLKVETVEEVKPVPPLNQLQIDECLPKLDLIFLLDSSGSIEQIYQEHVRWALALVDTLPIEPGAVRVGAVQYAGFPLTEFALGTYPKVQDIKQHLQQINFQSGITRTGYALRKAEMELFLNDRGARDYATKVIILFTDGLSIDDPLKPATQLRDHKGVKIYVVSVGNDGFKSEMSRIAGDCENVFGPEDLPRLRNALLNDAENARACSQIGPSRLKKQKSTTSSPENILHKGVLPPLDFLGLLNESSEEEETIDTAAEKLEEEDTTEDMSLEMENVTATPKEKSTTANVIISASEESSEEVTTTLKATTKVVVFTTTPKAVTTPPTATTKLSPSVETTTTAVTKTPSTSTESKKLKSSQKKIELVTVPKQVEIVPVLAEKKTEATNSKAFAAQLNSIDDSEDIIDVFDIPKAERKKPSDVVATTPATTSTTKRLTTRPTTTTSSTTSKPATTSSTTHSTTTTQAATIKKTRTTLARRNLATTTQIPIESTSATTRKRFTRRSTTAKSTTNVPTSTTTTTPRVTTTTTPRRRTTTTQKPFTSRPSFNSQKSNPCPMDILFLVDSSGSVQKNYDTQKQYIKEILAEAELTEKTHRVSLLQFAGSRIQKTEWTFDAFSKNSDLMTALNRVRFITGTTYIGAALDSGLQVLEDRRDNVPIIVVLVSDGFSQDDATFPAERIRMIPNIQFYSLSVSQLTNTQYLAQLVGNSKNVFVGSKASDLKDLMIKKLRCR